MARDDIVTSEVLYSIDEGESWRKLSFPNSTFTVNQFVTELSNDSRQFLFYGTRQHKGETIGMIGAINFAKLFKKECDITTIIKIQMIKYRRYSYVNAKM